MVNYKNLIINENGKQCVSCKIFKTHNLFGKGVMKCRACVTETRSKKILLTEKEIKWLKKGLDLDYSLVDLCEGYNINYANAKDYFNKFPYEG